RCRQRARSGCRGPRSPTTSRSSSSCSARCRPATRRSAPRAARRSVPVMWFDSWSDIARVVLVGCATYALLVVLLRSFGGRTLAQLNAFDFIVTVALGSTLATVLLSSDVAWAEGAVGIAVLVALQFAIAWI